MCVDATTELISYVMLAVLVAGYVVAMFKIASLSRQLRLQREQSPSCQKVLNVLGTTAKPSQTDIHSNSAS